MVIRAQIQPNVARIDNEIWLSFRQLREEIVDLDRRLSIAEAVGQSNSDSIDSIQEDVEWLFQIAFLLHLFDSSNVTKWVMKPVSWDDGKVFVQVGLEAGNSQRVIIESYSDGDVAPVTLIDETITNATAGFERVLGTLSVLDITEQMRTLSYRSVSPPKHVGVDLVYLPN